MKIKLLFSLTLLLSLLPGKFLLSQKVGLVLSGGGANGLAHIGVIQALEENNIPIDYITGTSSGAFVGAMYAAGYTTQEMKEFFLSDLFKQLVVGEIDSKDRFYFKNDEQNASMLNLGISKDFSLSNSLPTNLISPGPVDFELLKLFSGASSASDYCFDSLFIPFRCVAADINSKEEYIFSDGDLGTAIRASFTYPFYLIPLEVNGRVLFDGGLYNNFPHELMTNTFRPDYIIGVKVTSNDPPPKSDDLISQVKAMLISQTNFDLKTPGWIIEPKTNHQTFDFKDLEEVVDSGYHTALRQITELKKHIASERTSNQLDYNRKAFRAKMHEKVIGNVTVENVNPRKARFVSKSLWPKAETYSLSDFRKHYFRTLSDGRIRTIFPSLKLNPKTNLYEVTAHTTEEKPFKAEFGGVVSNRPISTAYVGMAFRPWGKNAWLLKGNTYFGKFYNSAMGSIRADFPTRIPFMIEAFLTFNSWNYFKSKSFFFDEDRPSYLIQKESYGGLGIGMPLGNSGKITANYTYAEMNDEYYQTKDFTADDIPDLTTLRPNSTLLEIDFNTQNSIQYANKGLRFYVMGRYSVGDEETNPGTTFKSALPNKIAHHEWIDMKLLLDYYYLGKGKLRLGIYSDSYFSNIPLLSNYTASILKSPAFQPTPESKTLFLESFRAYQYTSLGHKFIVSIVKSLDFRVEAYLFLPYKKVIRDASDQQIVEEGFNSIYSIANSTLVYNSPIGPLSVGLNYYYNAPEIAPENKTPLTFLFHFGYIIFNRKALY
ncbi:MAG: patatin-like phospholipase family protein [Flavobacteriales bacterium]|nr:patatin-like phospholipase family protein [Flavobacteriales bacterium]